jgi:hypothetical protein
MRLSHQSSVFFSLSTQSSSFLPPVLFSAFFLLALNTHNDYCREKFCPAKESSREGWMDVLVRWVVDNILPLFLDWNAANYSCRFFLSSESLADCSTHEYSSLQK